VAPCLLVLVAPVLAVADEVYLHGGAKFTGRIVDQTESMITVNIGDGIVGVPMSRVERIVEGRSALDDYEERAARLRPEDVDGWRSLGRFASQQGLSAQSRESYRKVIEVAPDDAEARVALGYVRLGGRWLTEDESYRERGFVEYEGEWMTPAEAELAQASAAAEDSRREAEQRAIEAEVQAAQAEQRAQEAEERAREAEERSRSYPVYWGGWGYGVTTWPSTYNSSFNGTYRR
jgi:tetratricopeptide (TPR) repeat protein